MNEVLNVFYNHVIPGALQGEIDCELLVHMICNVYFPENNRLLKATDKYEDLIIPTLIINNQNEFNNALIDYVETMLAFYQDYDFSSIDKQYYPAYIIATALANMSQKDYLDPTTYFRLRTEAIKQNPFILSETKVPVAHSDDFKGDLYYTVNKEKPNEEAPFRYTLFVTDGTDTYEFQTIRFFIHDKTAYIGAIQGNKPDEKTKYQNKVKRVLYKANEGINSENELYQTNPGAVVALTSFIALLNSMGINKVAILPYGIQRWNDKKILFSNLSEKLQNNKIEEPYKIKVVRVIERTSSYFDKVPTIRNQLKNSLLRFHYHLNGSSLTQDNEELLIECGQITNGNNNLLNEIYGTFNNLSTKKANQLD
ncbi:MAG: hypothetical protein IJO63_04985 [Bacilli bacterium]|nr:hypothetical protein [Bacilli bacterium]